MYPLLISPQSEVTARTVPIMHNSQLISTFQIESASLLKPWNDILLIYQKIKIQKPYLPIKIWSMT